MGSTIMALPSIESLRTRRQTPPRNALPPRLDAAAKNPFKIRLADVQGIRHEASVLVQGRYAQRGYETQKFDENPQRLTIVAYEGAAAIGTLSIGFDSPAGLLCDEVYRDEIDQLRASGRKVCEFIKFAANPTTASINIVAALFHVAHIYAHRIHGLDDVLMEVTPQHLRFYKRALGFRQIGSERINPRVNTMGVLSCCEFKHIGEQLLRFGGRIEARKEERSIYPYGFSAREEQGIVNRIRALPQRKDLA